jgi:MFS family permease
VNGIMANTMLQLQAPDRLRGRVMGFYSFVVLGMAPFGALQAGWVSEHFGVRTAFALGGIACMIMAGVVGFVTRRERQVSAPHPERSEGPSMRMSGTPEQDPSLRSG